MDGRREMRELMTLTGLPRKGVCAGEEWLRDYDPNAFVIEREGGHYYHKLAESADEVAEHVAFRAKSLYRMALRLERMVDNARKLWPESKLLKIMHRHLTRMREDVEELV
jgi:hypothetical protein